MSLRRRISLVAAATVAVAVAIAILISYFAVRNQLVGQIDNELRAQAVRVQQGVPGALGQATQLPGNTANNGADAPYVQYVQTDGKPFRYQGDLPLPTGAGVKAVAADNTNNVLSTVTVDGAELRMFDFHFAGRNLTTGRVFPIAVELARPLGPVESILSSLRLILGALFLGVVALAAVLGAFATRHVLSPLAEVTATAELIAETDDLGRRLEVRNDDEVGQLAGRFNEMLDRLESSRDELDASVISQRQLVADASHELRTPVTSLRTNIEVLLSNPDLEAEDRDRLLADVVEQSEELTALVSDLIEVARGDAPAETIEDTRLDRLVEEAIDRARRNTPAVTFVEHLDAVTVQSNPERLIRAINNLLDNAALHAGHGGPIEVTVDATGVTVRDHGDGIAEADVPHVFDRFYRGANSRSRQGSGLGLAIVRQVAEQHHGTVTAANAVDGGAVFSLRLPTSPVATSGTADDASVASDAEVSA